jgi:hypothetical protein
MATACLKDLAALERLRSALACDNPKPQGFQTVNEIATAWDLSRERTSNLLLKGLEAKLWERKKWGRFYVWKEILR